MRLGITLLTRLLRLDFAYSLTTSITSAITMSLPRRTESVTHPLIPGIVSQNHTEVHKVGLHADGQADKRLDLFTGGHYVDFNLSSALARTRLSGDEHINMQVWSAPGMSKPTFEQAIVHLQSDYRPYRVGDWLGKSWTNHWVKAELTIPDEFLQSDEEIICKLYLMLSARR